MSTATKAVKKKVSKQLSELSVPPVPRVMAIIKYGKTKLAGLTYADAAKAGRCLADIYTKFADESEKQNRDWKASEKKRRAKVIRDQRYDDEEE
jgi:hypothetical protein